MNLKNRIFTEVALKNGLILGLFVYVGVSTLFRIAQKAMGATEGYFNDWILFAGLLIYISLFFF